MSRTEAQIAASRANGLKSRGPTGPDGKAISRKNSYKHGMAGSGVVLRPVDSAEVEARNGVMLGEMAPRTGMGRYLVGRLAELTVLAEGCSRHRRAATALRVNHAEGRFDEARIAEVDSTLPLIAHEPVTLSRRLRSMPEGVDRMIAELLELDKELTAGRWGRAHGERASHLMGHRWVETPTTRVHALSEAIGGDFRHLDAPDGAGLSTADRITWARRAMAALIDQELEMLLAIYKTLDFAGIAEDRALAADLALVDMSKEGLLARRYEQAAEREVLKALKKLEEVEAAATAVGTPEEARASGAPGSSRQIHEPRSKAPAPAPPAPPPTPVEPPRTTPPAVAKPLDLGGEGYFELPFAMVPARKA